MTRRLMLVLTFGFALAVTGCSSTKPSATVTAVSVTGPPIAVGTTVQFTATATKSDGTTSNVTDAAAWQSSNPLVASVDAAGNVTGVTVGESTITVTYQSLTGTDIAQVVVDASAAGSGS